jgi:hypothetical protein
MRLIAEGGMKFKLIKARFLPIFFLIAGCTAAGDGSTVEMQSVGRQPAIVKQTDAKVAAQAFSPLNTTCLIDDIPVVLQNGRAEQDIMHGAAVKRKTSAIGVPVAGDLDRDGSTDAVLLLIICYSWLQSLHRLPSPGMSGQRQKC